jgi:hypothetical protein
MRIIKSLIFALTVAAPVASYAFSNDNSAVKSALKDHQAAIVEYAEKNSKPVPKVVEYKYGMNLDIAKVVRTSPELRECKVIPQLMTYEDSNGDLKTLQYQVMSRCRGKN